MLPSVIKARAQQRLSAVLQRQVSIGQVHFNPFTFAVTVDTLSAESADATPFLSWRRLYANFDSFSFLRREWRFQEINLDGFTGYHTGVPDGAISLTELLAKFTQQPNSAGHAHWPLYVGHLTVTGAILELTDPNHPGFTTRLGPATFSLRDFYTGGSRQAPGEFSATTESGESFSWKGSVSFAPFRSTGEIELTKVQLKKYAPFYDRFVQLDVLDGELAASFHYEFSAENDKNRFRLSEGKLSLANLKLAKRGASDPVVSLDQVAVSESSASWPEISANIGRVAIIGGSVLAKREAAGLDLAALFSPPGAAPAVTFLPAGSAQAVPPKKIKIGGISIHGLALTLEDHTTPSVVTLRFTDLSSDLRNLSFANPDAPMPFGFRATLAPDGEVHAAGTLTLSPLKTELGLELTNLSLANFSPYFETATGLRLARGTLNTALYFGAQAVPGGTVVVSAQGDATVDNFAATGGDPQIEIAGWRALSAKGFEFNSNPARLLAADLALTEPFYHQIREALPEEPPAAVAFPAASPGAPDTIFVSVDRLSLEKASYEFTDRSLQPEAGFSINQIGGHVDGLSSSDLARATVDLRGRIEGITPVTVTGKFNLLAPDPFADLRLAARGIDLIAFRPFFARVVGRELQKGSLTLDLRCRINRRKLDSTLLATFDGLSLGGPSGTVPALPFKFVQALLQDPAGHIALDLPLAGSIDNPEVRSGRIVWRTLTSTLGKSSSAPFAYLSALAGNDQGQALALLRFVPGNVSQVDGDETRKLDAIASALHERPLLRLEIAGGFDPAVDVPALKERLLEDQMRTLVWNDRRAVDPSLTFDQVQIDPLQRKGMIRRLFYKTFPNERPKRTGGGGDDDDGEPVAAQRGNLGAFHRKAEPTASHVAPRQAMPQVDSTPSPDGTTETTSTIVTIKPPTFEEMYARLQAQIAVDDNSLRQLAADRANAVRDYLVNQGQLEADRVVLATNGDRPVVIKGPRVELRLR